MADHSKPILTDNYTDVLSQIRGRLDDQAKQFDPAVTSATNIQTGTIRWDSASSKDQKWNGTAWVDKSSNYSFNQITLTGGVANTIPYLNSSKVLTTGSALTFDGTNQTIGAGGSGSLTLGLKINAPSSGGGFIYGLRNGADSWLLGDANVVGGTSGYATYVFGNNPILWYTNGSEQMRLTSTGLGIGTSSPSAKLHVVSSGNPTITLAGSDGAYTSIFNMVAAGGGGSIINANGGQNTLLLQTNSVTRATLDTSGNWGLGVVPSAWASYQKAMDFGGAGNYGAISARSGLVEFGNNCFYNDVGSSSDKYKNTAAASKYQLNAGSHIWYTAPSGTAGNAISFTQAMTLDSSGRLGIGTTSPTGPLHVMSTPSAGSASAINLGNAQVGSGVCSINYTSTGFNFAGVGGSEFLLLAADTGPLSLATFASNPIKFVTNQAERARITSSGNFLVGNTSGTSKITASGVVESTTGGFKFPDGTTQTSAVLLEGVAVGHGGGNVTSNTRYGSTAFQSNTTGSFNTSVGYSSLQSNITGNVNVAMGSNALRLNTSGFRNTAIGHEALGTSTTSSYNTAVGAYALEFFSTGQGNTALGDSALNNLTSYSNCTGVGWQADVTGNNQVQLGDSSTTTYVYGTVQNRSDLRDKTDVADTKLGLDFINALRAVDYRWDMREDYRPEKPKLPEDASDEQREQHAKDLADWVESCKLTNIKRDGSKKRNRIHHGLIAQEVRGVIEKLGVDFGGFQDHSLSGGDDVLSIGYDELIAPLIKSVQELSAQNKILTERLDAIEGKSSV